MTNPLFSVTCILEVYKYQPHGIIPSGKKKTTTKINFKSMTYTKTTSSSGKATLLQIMRGIEKDFSSLEFVTCDPKIVRYDPIKHQNLTRIVTYMKEHKEKKVGSGFIGAIRKVLSVLQNILTFQGYRTSIGIANDVLNKLKSIAPLEETTAVLEDNIQHNDKFKDETSPKPYKDSKNPKITRFEGTNISVEEID